MSVNVKSLFFDAKGVLDAVDAATARVLSRFGAFVRQAARSSIRPRTQVSQPGQPPSDHVGAMRRAVNRRRKAQGLAPRKAGFQGVKHILFGYDPIRRSVVIGPIAKESVGVVPPLLEEGGRGIVVHDGKQVMATFRPHPFMGPALRKVQPQLPRMWQGSVSS